jgi:hypothetical protein
MDEVLAYAEDPAGFVCYAFPWGEPGTVLAEEVGPEAWSLEVLDYIGQHLSDPEAIRVAAATGHGTTKTTTLVWLILWAMSTKPHPSIRVTAGTANQLSTTTWRELAFWHQLAVNAHWFQWTATKFYHVDYPETWYASAIPWNADKPQAFAGVHAEHVLFGFDEASTIADGIWEVVDGAMSTPGAIWVAFGNPEQATGRFRDCFGRFRSLWHTWQVDARTVRRTNKVEIARQIAAYGEDSDFVRVRWLGKFPRAGVDQFISEALLDEAQARTPEGYEHMPKVLGVDVGGSVSPTVLILRQGVALPKIQDYMGLRTDQVADEIARWLLEDDAIAQVFVDTVGIGSGVHGDLIRLGFGDRVTAVISGARGTELLPNSSIAKYFNMRAQMWGHGKRWLEEGGCLPKEPRQLRDDLLAPKVGYAGERQIQLERKEDMAIRHLPSPHWGDAWAYTFCRPIAPRARPKKPLNRDITMTMRDGWMLL